MSTIQKKQSQSSTRTQPSKGQPPASTQKGIIISGFPCIGKSYLTKNKYEGRPVFDLDSSGYAKTEKGQQEYLNDVKKHAAIPRAIVLVSTHETFRKQMASNNLQYIRVFPSRDLKQEWLGRQENRAGGKDGLWKFMNDNWEMMAQIDKGFSGETSKKCVLKKGEYLGHVIPKLVGK
ncbi:hypothetical protein VMCG_10464 [Cytospora schulzeri]|uniref:Zeta toxin domain-containing protein n=1 Tax=Cytospora schulzeri TaxID=448051 RepID=A0A423VCC3_9PEZI|nr:hypothetical protein VMCG_10464 [Valsa malicola]